MEASGELDFTSSSFNPLKALYTDGLQPPVPNVQIFNNINEYAQCLKLGKPLPKRGLHGANVQGSEVGTSLAQRLKNIAENKVRSRNRDPSRLAHLMKVKSKTDGIEEKVAMLEKTKQRPRQKNVLERMELGMLWCSVLLLKACKVPRELKMADTSCENTLKYCLSVPNFNHSCG